MTHRILLVLLLGMLAASGISQDLSPIARKSVSNGDLARTARELKDSARDSYRKANLENAKGDLTALLELYRGEYWENPSWQGTYRWSRRLAEVAHEYLRAGQLDDALAILGEAADLEVPLRNGFDNGLANVSGGLHRRLAALDSDERAERITEKQFELFTKLTPDRGAGQARYVRVDLPNKTEILSLAEVEVISGGKNVARGKPATQSSVQHDGVASRAVDGNRNGHYGQALSTTHTGPDREPWWEVDLGQSYMIEEVLLWNRTEAGQDRLRGVRVQLLDEHRDLIWELTAPGTP